MNKVLCIIIGLLVLALVLYFVTNKEKFGQTVSIVPPNYIKDVKEGFIGEVDQESVDDVEYKLTGTGGQYVKRTDVERSARSAARVYCPVAPDYDPNDYIKKTEIESDTFLKDKCPPVPDMKDYVLKTTIPPVQQCPPCICPKVKVTAGLCSNRDCSVEMCEKKVKCPPIKPCPTDSVKVCPAIKIPSLDDLEKRFNIVKYVERLLTKTDTGSKEKLINIAKSINDKYSATTTTTTTTTASSNKTEGFTDYVEGEDAEAEEEEMAYGDNSLSLLDPNIVNKKNTINQIFKEIEDDADEIIAEEEAIQRQLNEYEKEPEEKGIFAMLQPSPSQAQDSECKPATYSDRFGDDGILGSIFNN
jgi:hypothetical protein